jgi:hypothetical protein
MNIKVNFFSSYPTASFLRESVPSFLNVQRMKIIAVVAIAFACLAVCYALSRPSPIDDKKVLDGKGMEISKKTEGELKENDPLSTQKRADSLATSGESGILNGKGIRNYPNGEKAEGEFKNGFLHGQGKVAYPDGRVIEGNFKHGKIKEGKIRFPDGRVSEGIFRDGVLNGPGKITHADRTVSIGVFKDGKLNGHGQRVYLNGQKVEVEFENDQVNVQCLIDSIFANGKRGN